MRYLLRILTMTVALVGLTCAGTPAHGDSTREFVNSCVYGTLAGSLVGVASLAFTHQPGDNLRNISRGASLGLYFGIILGLYAINSTPDSGGAAQQGPSADLSKPLSIPSIGPIASEQHGIEGANVGWSFTF